MVPLGFFVSVLALGLSAPRDWTRAASVYVLVLGTLTALGSWGAWQWLERHPEWAATGHCTTPIPNNFPTATATSLAP